MTGSWKGRGNQYIEFARVVYCKLPTNGKQLPAFPLKAVTGIKPRTSEVGGKSVTTLPQWPPGYSLIIPAKILFGWTKGQSSRGIYLYKYVILTTQIGRSLLFYTITSMNLHTQSVSKIQYNKT